MTFSSHKRKIDILDDGNLFIQDISCPNKGKIIHVDEEIIDNYVEKLNLTLKEAYELFLCDRGGIRGFSDRSRSKSFFV